MRRGTRAQYVTHRHAARALVHERLEHFNCFYKYEYKKVFIRNTRSRWGSCSQKGNLNFNYKLLFLPPLIRDYIIVHELCHLKEFNHSVRFWALVAQSVPEYRQLRKALRTLERSRVQLRSIYAT